MSFFLTSKASKRRLKEAEDARKNRLEILKAWSQGQVSRRDLMKWGLFSAGGVLLAKQGLSLEEAREHAAGVKPAV
jgi:hypothetical protein